VKEPISRDHLKVSLSSIRNITVIVLTRCVCSACRWKSPARSWRLAWACASSRTRTRHRVGCCPYNGVLIADV
jgi:hypothetical protein